MLLTDMMRFKYQKGDLYNVSVMIWRMDVQQMRYFLDVAETEHMTRSADRLHVAQPALSRSIARLEKEVGARLFARAGRGIALTEEGRVLQAHLAAALDEIDQARSEIDAIEDGSRRTVHLRIDAASALAIEAVSRWMEARPDGRVELVQQGHSGKPAGVAVGQEPVRECVAQRSFRERIMLALPKGERRDGRPVALGSLSGRSFIALAGSFGFRAKCDELCLRHGVKPTISLESDNPAVVRRAISLGLGIGFWPEHSWGELGGTAAELAPVDSEDFVRCIRVCLLRESEYDRSLYEALVSLFEAAFAQGSAA